MHNDKEQLQKLIETIKFISNNQILTKQLIKNLMQENYDNENYWKYILELVPFDNEFIYSNLNSINFAYLLKYQKIDSNFLMTYYEILERINIQDVWNILFKYQTLDNNALNIILSKYSPFDKEIWDIISRYQHLNSDIFDLYSDLLNWDHITVYQNLNFNLFIKYQDKLNWSLIHCNNILNNYVTDSNIMLLNSAIVDKIGYFDNISDAYIFNNLNNLSFNSIISVICARELSLEQINYLLNLYPNNKQLISKVCENQNIDDNIIMNYYDYIDWEALSENFNWTNELFEKYYDKINFGLLDLNINFDKI
jgi:hypothetical protein